MDIFEADDNSTPLTAEEKDGLKLKWIPYFKFVGRRFLACGIKHFRSILQSFFNFLHKLNNSLIAILLKSFITKIWFIFLKMMTTSVSSSIIH